jgi:hypothetical protein
MLVRSKLLKTFPQWKKLYSVSHQRKCNIFFISKVSTSFAEFGLEMAETVLEWGNKHIFLENRRKSNQNYK